MLSYPSLPIISPTKGKSIYFISLFSSLMAAVEATKLNLFPQQLVQYRDVFCACNQDRNVISANYNGDQMRFHGTPLPSTFQGINQQSFYKTKTGALICDMQAKTESRVTNTMNPRKRCRDSSTTLDQLLYAQKNVNTAVDEYVSSQIQQQELEIYTIISQHTKKLRLELQERQRQQAKLLVSAIGEGAMKRLKEKEEQIQRMGKLNMVLEERVKSLYIENQLWRDLAQTNEATANSLRTNLQQLLLLAAHVGGCEEEEEERLNSAVAEEDVQSCCGSSDDVELTRRNCRRCGERESCVLLLPCRHLCLCDVCGRGSSQIQDCPLCNTSMKATLHLNMSC